VRDEKKTDGLVVDPRPDVGDRDRAGVRAREGDLGFIGEYSPKPKKSRKSEYSSCEITSQKVIDFEAFKAKVTIHSSAFFEMKAWKRSRVKKGWLIARIKGYDPVESEYGVHYLKVLGRNPKKTSGDYSLYEHAGFFTWQSLQAGGRLVRERKRNGRLDEDRANAS
jgi:hypothetical protein